MPHLLTAGRGLAVFAVAWLLHVHPGNAAFWLFLVAVSTDLLDGWLARRFAPSSRIGLFLDPMADKLLFVGTWLALWTTGRAPGWLVVALLLRDAIVAGGWAWVASGGRFWRPSRTGQVMAAYEGVALAVLLFHGPWLDVHWRSVGVCIGTLALLLSLASLIGYAVTGPGAPCNPRYTRT